MLNNKYIFNFIIVLYKEILYLIGLSLFFFYFSLKIFKILKFFSSYTYINDLLEILWFSLFKA